MRQLTTFFLLVILSVCSAAAETPTAAISQAAALRESGDFKGAATVLSGALTAPDLSAGQRKELAFQLDVLRRIKLDYTLTQDDVFGRLSSSLKGLTSDEFNHWLGQGWFDRKTIDGQTRFVNDSVRNFYFQHPELKTRRSNGGEKTREPKGRLAICRAIKKAAHDQNTPYVLPHNFICTMWVSAEENAAPPGQVIRAWLPVPRRYPFQNQFKVIRSSPPLKTLAPETSPIRSAYFEQPASKEGAAEFSIAYSYTASGVYFDMDPARVHPVDPKDLDLKKFTDEAPHIVFTDKISKLASQIAGNDDNPLRVARAIFDWVGSNIKYGYAREYSTLTNLGDYCLTQGYGDCGQEAMLFITLCRCRGIPARWQSGWNTFPGGTSNHDWCEIYLTPYGWVPVDPWAGIYATRYCTVLTPAERAELHDFYLGGLDYYRMAANSDHNMELDPPKLAPRSDNVDFQRGELECNGHNIYFDKFSFGLRVEEAE